MIVKKYELGRNIYGELMIYKHVTKWTNNGYYKCKSWYPHSGKKIWKPATHIYVLTNEIQDNNKSKKKFIEQPLWRKNFKENGQVTDI